MDSKLGSAEQEAVLDQIKAACRPQHGPSASSSTLNDAIRSAAAIEPFPAHAVLETLMNASVDPARSPLTANPLHDPGAQERTFGQAIPAAYLEVRGEAAWPNLAAFIEKSLSQPDTHQFNIHVLPSIVELPQGRMWSNKLPLVESLWALDGNAWIRPVTEQFAKSGIDLVDRFFPHLIYRQTPSPERLSLLIDQYAKRDELPELCRALELPWFKDVKAGVFVADPSHKHRDLFAAQVKMFFGKTFASCSLDQVAKLANAYSLACMWSGEADNESLVRALVMRCVQVHPDDQRTERFYEIVESIVDSADRSASHSGAETVLLDGLFAAVGKTGPANWTRTVEVFLSRPAGEGQRTPDETREYLLRNVMQEAESLTVTQLSRAIYCIANSGEKEVGRPQRSGLLQAMEALKKSPCGTWRAGHVAAVAQGMAKAIVHTGSQDVAAWLRSELAAFNFESDVLVEVNAALDQELGHLAPRVLTESKAKESSVYVPDVQGRVEQLELLQFGEFSSGEALLRTLNKHAPLESSKDSKDSEDSEDIRYALIKNLLVSHADKMSHLLPPMTEILLRRLTSATASEEERSEAVQELLSVIETFAQQYDIDPLISGKKTGGQRNANRDRSALEALRECGRQMRAVRAPGSAAASTMLGQITRQLKVREDALAAQPGVDQKGRPG